MEDWMRNERDEISHRNRTSGSILAFLAINLAAFGLLWVVTKFAILLGVVHP